MVQEIILTTYSIALPTLLGYIVWLLKRHKKDRDANSRGTKCLLRDKLIYYHDKYCELGYIPAYAYKNYVEMFEAYTKLGGNGLIPKMKEEVDELEIRQADK